VEKAIRSAAITYGWRLIVGTTSAVIFAFSISGWLGYAIIARQQVLYQTFVNQHEHQK
jgi:hypothetical protein